VRFAVAFGAVAVLAGVGAGLSAFTFAYADGAAYLTDDPAACGNCHVMREQLAGWGVSSHRAVAVCNDCHAPKQLVAKYAVKAINGFNHSWAFTTGRFHEPIRITAMNESVTEGACRRCHGGIVEAIDAHPAPSPTDALAAAHATEPVSCIRCHRSVGHLH
jgi:cytochrome c nitrite reductase small subunit